jgi:hypothetical protein
VLTLIPRNTIVGIRTVKRPVNRPVTKFGGQPTWLEKPAWPKSKGWAQRPMMFLCQIALESVLPAAKGKLAYIFLTHPSSPDDTFFDPDVTEWNGGESAVFVQPGGRRPSGSAQLTTGPTLFDLQGRPFEGVPDLKRGQDPDFLSLETRRGMSEADRKHYFDSADGNKLGGTPGFFQGDAWPRGRWLLLLQLNANFLPFVLTLGASPTLFAFISPDGTKGGLLAQDM